MHNSIATRKTWYALLLLLGMVSLSTAQNDQEEGLPFITNYLAKDYGAHPQNWDIVKDKRGVMYFGNSLGLLEFDGARWRLLSLPKKNTCRSLAIDQNGRIYVGSQGEFGYMAPDSSGQLQFISLLPVLPADQHDFNDIWSIRIVGEDIYFQARGKIFRFTPQQASTSAKENWKVKIWLPEDQFMYAFEQRGEYYVHQRSVGLMKMEEDSLVLIPGGGQLANERLQVMLSLDQEDETNANPSYLLYPFYSGPFVFDSDGIRPLPQTPALQNFLQDNLIYKGVKLPNGNIALASTVDGLGIINPEGELLRKIDRTAGLEDNSVYSIFADTSATGGLWLGLDKGIAQIEIESPLTLFNEQSGLTSSVISLHRHQGFLYVGTTIGLFRLNPTTGNFQKIPEVGSEQIFGLLSIQDMLVVPSEGVIGIKGDQFSQIKNSVSGDYQVSCVVQIKTNPGLIFLGLIDGLAVLRYENGRWFDEGKIPGIYEQIWSIEEDDEGTLWLGTASQGVLRVRYPMDYRAGTTVQTDRFGPEQGLPPGGLKILSPLGKPYFVSKDGLFVFDKDRGQFVPDITFSVVDFGGDHNEYSLYADNEKQVWISFGKECAVAIPQDDGTYQIEKKPFRPFANINVFRVYPEEDGIVWFGTDDGLIRYDSRIKQDYESPYNSLIRSVIQGEDSLLFSGAGQQVSFPKIAFENNTLQFEYAAPTFDQSEKTEYQTWLEGFDPHWSAWTRKTEKEYTNLPEKNYVFHVRAKNIYGNISTEAVYQFTVLPPWHRTWWALLFYVMAGVGLLYVLVRWRTHQLQAQRENLERTVVERTREIGLRAEELATVNEISRALAVQLQLEELIKLVGDQLRDLFKADIVYVALLDRKAGIINFPYQHGDDIKPLKYGSGLTSQIIESGEGLLVNRDIDKNYDELGIEKIGKIAASYLGVPIPSGREIIGVLSVQSIKHENRFTESDQSLLSTIASHVGVAIHNAQLFEETQAAYAEVSLAREAADEANEAKSTFLSTVSHELRTPLTSVLGFAKIVRKRLDERIFPALQTDDPKIMKAVRQVTQNLEVITSEGDRLTQLINDVLDLAKIEAGKIDWHLEPLQVADVIDQAVNATQALFDAKKLSLKKVISPNLPDFTGDRNKLIQVVINLLSNAVKFTDKGSVSVGVSQQENTLVVAITDSGIGIAPEDQSKVFEKFKQVGDTLTDKPQGTGLGLPICQEIVEHHGGRLWMKSELGKGSTFYFSLPLIVGNSRELPAVQLESLIKQLQEQLQLSAIPASGHGQTILVVDDDNPIRNLLHQELSEAGYLVREAANGREALESVRKDPPDLILLDVMMPEMNGFDVAAILKNDPQTMDIPIIILSIVQDEERGMRIGVDRYLTKPIDTEKLFREVGSLLEQGKSPKKVMVVDEHASTLKTVAQVLQARGYQVVESNGPDLIEKALANRPDIIILNAVLNEKHEEMKSLRFEKGMENVLFLVYR